MGKYDPMHHGKHVFQKLVKENERVERFVSYRDYRWEMRSAKLGPYPNSLLATYKRIR